MWYCDPTSPSGLRWNCDIIDKRGFSKRYKDREAGTIQRRQGNDREMYWQVRFQGKGFKAHRVIYVLMTGGDIDDLVVDHKDGDGLNNDISNLRAVTHIVNRRNCHKMMENTTGVTGVSIQYAGPNHTSAKYYRAAWMNLEGKTVAKLFPCADGEDEAFRLACEYRARMIEELNAQGAGYTERHGKELMEVLDAK